MTSAVFHIKTPCCLIKYPNSISYPLCMLLFIFNPCLQAKLQHFQASGMWPRTHPALTEQVLFVASINRGFLLMKKSRVSCSIKDKSVSMWKTCPKRCWAAHAQHQPRSPQCSWCRSVRRLNKQPEEAGSFNSLQGFLFIAPLNKCSWYLRSADLMTENWQKARSANSATKSLLRHKICLM